MTDESSAPTKRPKGRSPSYPALDLEDAIEMARRLYVAEGQHPVPAESVARDWSYKSVNGPAALALAALKRFGLTDDEGTGPSRRIRVSDLAIHILEHPDESEKRKAIQTAALNPPIHRDMWNKYGQHLPSSDEGIRWFLKQERGFTDTGVSEFIPEYRSTIAYAHLYGTATVETQTVDKGEPENEDLQSPPRRQRRHRVTQPSGDTRVYAVPVRAGTDVEVEGPFPLTEDEWTQFMAILGAMKGSLVSNEPRTRDEDDPAPEE